MPLKVLAIFGTRPEAIKLAPVIRALQQEDGFICRVCATGQHRELLAPVLRLFDIQPDYDLEVMTAGQPLAQLTARILTGLEPILAPPTAGLAAERPDWVLVQGDTTTTLAASLAAYYARLRVAHVEAGLRSHDPNRPFPEEVNRRLADALATLHFAPTEAARQNLLAEGIPDGQIRVTGNTVIDALLEVAGRPYQPAAELTGLFEDNQRLVVATTHRRESFGPPLHALCRAVRQLAERYPRDLRIIFPVHLNPNVQDPARAELNGLVNVALVEPLDYQSFIHLMKRAYFLLTDSGGLQEEAAALGLPVLVLRDLTDRPEAVEAGSARVVGTDPEAIVRQAARLLDHPEERDRMAGASNPYGDGKAAQRIVAALKEFAPRPEPALQKTRT